MNHSNDSLLIACLMQAMYNDPDIISATAFWPQKRNSNYRVRLTRVVYKEGWFKREQEFRVVIGKPNYKEREFLKRCRKAKQDPRKFWVSQRMKGK